MMQLDFKAPVKFLSRWKAMSEQNNVCGFHAALHIVQIQKQILEAWSCRAKND